MNPDYRSPGLPDWYVDLYFAVLPEVTVQELAKSTLQCAMKDGLVVVKPVGDRTLEVLVNNNGRRREFTPRQLVDFLATCRNKGDSVSIDDNLASSFIGNEIEKELARIFGENGYLLSSARTPDEGYLRTVLPSQRAPAAQQLPRS